MDAQVKQWTKMLDQSYAKLPVLPKGASDFIVSVAPWLALIFGLLSILTGVAGFGFLAVLSPFAAVAGAGGYAVMGLVASLILLIEGVVMLLAFSPLKGRHVRGWNLLFWVLVLSVLSSIVSLRVFSIVEAIIGALIGYYFLYEVRNYYK
jgi:hypothetical protein